MATFSRCTLRPRARLGSRVCLAVFLTLLVGGCGKGTNAAPAIPANATPEERAIIQARAALGPEDKLTAVNTLVLAGNITDSKNAQVGQILLLFKKPARQRSEIRAPDQSIAIQGSDGVEGWSLSIDKNNNKKIAVLKSAEEIQNVYMSMENLYFYRATERIIGATVTNNGDAQYRDTACWKVTFHYPNNLNYVRYLDRSTGQLRGTVLDPLGAEFVEEGEKVVDGIKFPVTLHTYTKDGQLAQNIKFDKILVNQPLDDRLFDQPLLTDLYKMAPVAKPAGTAAPAPAAKPAAKPAAAPPANSGALLTPALLPPLKPN